MCRIRGVTQEEVMLLNELCPMWSVDVLTRYGRSPTADRARSGETAGRQPTSDKWRAALAAIRYSTQAGCSRWTLQEALFGVTRAAARPTMPPAMSGMS